MKPFGAGRLADLSRDKISSRQPAARTEKERVVGILEHGMSDIVQDWLIRVKQSTELNKVSLSDQERTGYFPS